MGVTKGMNESTFFYSGAQIKCALKISMASNFRVQRRQSAVSNNLSSTPAEVQVGLFAHTWRSHHLSAPFLCNRFSVALVVFSIKQTVVVSRSSEEWEIGQTGQYYI